MRPRGKRRPHGRHVLLPAPRGPVCCVRRGDGVRVVGLGAARTPSRRHVTRVAAMASQLARHRSDTSLSENTNTTSAPSINNVIVTVFLCLLVFVFINLGPVRAVLLDVAPLAAPVANVFFI